MEAWKRRIFPLGEMILAADEIGLTGVWFADQKYFALPPEAEEGQTKLLELGEQWLEEYFAGRQPRFLPPLHLRGTPFRQCVWQELLTIPYGSTVTYGALAGRVAERLGRARMSAQAVGGAVGHNPVSVIVPCHRVIGADGSLTGYAGSLERKAKLLALERAGRDVRR